MKPRTSPADPASLERQVRPLRADKVSGNPVGIGLLLPEHLRLGAEILSARADATSKPLVLADKEHYSQELFQAVRQLGCFDLLCALSTYPESLKRWGEIPEARFAPRWPGYATATQPYGFKNDPHPLYHELVERSGLKKEDLQYQGFLSPVLRPEVQALTHEYPQRWQVEEFFKFNQAMGWHRTGTLNLNVRYAPLTMALLAQAAVQQLRQRLGPPIADGDATHRARHRFEGLEGDMRVREDTLVITLYNAPNAELLPGHYENLPDKLRQQGVDPHIPWLYNFPLDFRFK